MSAIYERDLTPETLSAFDPNNFLPTDQPLDQKTRGGIFQFVRNSLKQNEGPIKIDTAKELIGDIADFEQGRLIKSRIPFRYMPSRNSFEDGERGITADDTVAGAVSNMRYMVDKFGGDTFAVIDSEYGFVPPVQWQAPIDDNYAIRIRGGSGAGSFSIDFGLGRTDPDRPWTYNELWRNGIDTYEDDNGFGARFIRTGSGIKQGDSSKARAFERFRRQYGILPQRFLGIIGLYFMREVNPDYALAATTLGAEKLSTLGNSKGRCDYTGIFSNIGFQPSGDPNWLTVEDFDDGFYDALDLSKIRKNEADLLSHAVESVNSAHGINLELEKTDTPIPFQLCSDESDETLERELGIYLPSIA